mmetsp:Transcript_2410/g.8603  ORF Transcript_2410/g.8603 Transcript_2410/m.8603 type:complete len:253 (-) Transcript_2410:91-849(-)
MSTDEVMAEAAPAEAAKEVVAEEQTEEREVDIPPKETLYVHNLNEKVKLDELKKALYALFSQHGEVLDIVACKTYKLRGQAWIIFSSTASATAALQHLNGFEFYGKPLVISYAKELSDVITERKGGVVDKEARRAAKRKRQESFLEELKQKKKRAVAVRGKPGAKGSRNEVPNNILFVENIPTSLDAKIAHDMVTELFSPYEGLQEIRIVPGKGVAFVEYATEAHAVTALNGLQGFKISPECFLALSYVRKE